MITGCDSVKMLPVVSGLVTVPDKTNDKECYALKIVNYQSNKDSSNYPNRLAGMLVTDHNVYLNLEPRIMSHTNYSIKMMDNREVLVSGSRYGMYNFIIDNFLYFKLDSATTQHYATGTGDSAAIGFSGLMVSILGIPTVIPFDVQNSRGSAHYVGAFTLSTKLNIPVNTQFSLDSYALDAGSTGGTDDAYLIFR